MGSTTNRIARVTALSLFASLVACAAAHPVHEGEASGSKTKNDLTSNTALSRDLKFQGVVYVDASAGDDTIARAVKKQTQSAFGALRTAYVGVNSRELKDVDPSTFQKQAVTVVDKSNPSATQQMLRVTYTYTDKALVPKTMATRSTISLGLLGQNYFSHTGRILTECTANDKEAHEFEGSIWYVFDPSLSSCKQAMATEQQQIDADRAALADATTQVTLAEVGRLYVPMTVSLDHDGTNGNPSWPEYDQLFSGGVSPGKLVIGMVSGKMDDWAAGEHHDTIDDVGYDMWLQGLREILNANPGFTITATDPVEDLTTFTVGTSTVSASSFNDLIGWELDGVTPTGIDASQQRDLRVAVANKIYKHWLTFDMPVQVSIGGADPQAFTVEVNSYFGAETDSTPHKRAIKNSDVFVYNGHSYIGYGPLDPSRFTSDDFPASYQLFFINGCVSYNYYEKDYFPLKQGGTQNLDIITNGLESWVNGSGPSMGRFIAALIDGNQENYAALLKAAEFTGFGYSWGQDALRVVDGELDNVYDPSQTPIVLQK